MYLFRVLMLANQMRYIQKNGKGVFIHVLSFELRVITL